MLAIVKYNLVYLVKTHTLEWLQMDYGSMSIRREGKNQDIDLW